MLEFRVLLTALVCGVGCVLGRGEGTFDPSYGGLTDSLLREVVARMGDGLTGDLYLAPEEEQPPMRGVYGPEGYQRRQDDIVIGPSIRDQEYLEHSSLWGHQYMQGGAGEGFQRLRPDGSLKNLQVVKTDAVLPAYCNPPNPCPIGYTAEDGCLEEFSNTAAFSREYQGAQDCMCDAEHMFDCPGASRETQLDALAQSIQNQGLVDDTLDKIIEGEHKNLVAKKFFKQGQKPGDAVAGATRRIEKKSGRTHRTSNYRQPNPYLVGEKLPVVAKKQVPHM